MGIAPRQIGWSNESNLLWQVSKQLERLNGVTSTSLNTIIADLSTKVTNQQGVPSFRADTFANIPAAGQTGRMFVSTDTLSIYRDNGTTWDLISGGSGGGITGTGTTNYLPKWTGATAIGNSQIFDNGTGIGIGTITPTASYTLDVVGASRIRQQLTSDGGIRVTGLTTILGTGPAAEIAYTGGQSVFGGYNRSLNTSSDTVLRGNPLRMWVGGTTEVAQASTAGNFLIGTTTDAGFKLDVNGTFRSTGDATINGVTAGRGNGNISTNTSFGVLTFQGFNPTGNENSAFGFQAINLLTTGQRNTGIGLQALLSTSTGNRNTGLGYRAGLYISSGSDNTIIGNNNAINLTTGVHNTVLGSNTGHGIVTGSYNVVIGGNITGLSSSLSNTIILADGQGNIRQYIDSTGNVGIGTTSPAYKLDVSGTSRFTQTTYITGGGLQVLGGMVNPTGNGGFELEYTSGEAYCQTYNRTTLNFVPFNIRSSVIKLSIGTTEVARFSTSNNFLIGTNTDAGFKLDVNGTARIQGNVTTTGRIQTVNSFGGFIFTLNAGTYCFGDGVTAQGANGQFRSPLGSNIDTTYIFGGSNVGQIRVTDNGRYEPTFNGGYLLADNVGEFLRVIGEVTWNEGGRNLDFRIEGDTNQNLFFLDASADNIGIGTNTPNASALLDISSTTKGFLPPRMTGAQAEAIASPAEGLMVYATSAGTGAITSKGWWGFEGATWVKLN